MRRPDAHLWKQAEEKELSALFKMNTFSEKIFIDTMTPAQRRLLLSTRWVYRYKTVDATKLLAKLASLLEVTCRRTSLMTRTPLPAALRL